jgi:hypothetical protein
MENGTRARGRCVPQWLQRCREFSCLAETEHLSSAAANRHALQLPYMSGKPLWTAEEVILVLSLYFEHGQLPASDRKVVEVSRLMTALPVNINGEHAGTVRRPGAVAMKLANFAYADNPRGGLRNVGPRDRRFFDTYKNCRDDCHKRAEAIRQSVTNRH